MGAQLQLVFFVAGVQREVVDRAAGQRPGALRAVAVDDDLDALIDAVVVRNAEHEALVIVGLLLQRQRDGQEVVHRSAVRHRDDGAVDALDAVILADALSRHW